MNLTQGRVIKEISDRLEINPEVIDIGASLADLGADDIDELEILMAIENEFEIDIDDDDFFGCNSIGAIVALVETLKRK